MYPAPTPYPTRPTQGRRSSIPLQNCRSIIQSTAKKQINKSILQNNPVLELERDLFHLFELPLAHQRRLESLFKLQLLPLPVFDPTKLAHLTCGLARNVILWSRQRHENHLRKAKFQLNSSPHPPFVFLLFFNIPRDSGGGRRPKYYRGPAYEWISMSKPPKESERNVLCWLMSLASTAVHQSHGYTHLFPIKLFSFSRKRKTYIT
jgi:hypothetical protein